MILMWLGSFVFLLFGLTEAQKSFAAIFSSYQKSILDKGLDAKLPTMALRILSLVGLEASPRRSLYSGLALYNLRILNLRPSVLMMCMSSMGAWFILFLASLFLGFSGFFLMGFCVLGIFTFTKDRNFKAILKLAFSVGAFLLASELVLRNSSILLNLLGQGDMVFFLADGRFTTVLPVMLVAILLSLVIRVEFWSVALALSLLLTNTLSFNGALALVTGERIGVMILFWWRSRHLNQDCIRVGKQLSAVSILGAILGFWLAGEARTLLDFGFSFENSSFADKTAQFVALYGVILAVQFAAQMIWGHFGSLVKVDEVQDAKYFAADWFALEILSPESLHWAKDKVHKRLSEIRYHLQGLGTLQEGQVPTHIQARLRDEEQKLSSIVFKDIL